MKIAVLTPHYGGPLARVSLGYMNALLVFSRDPSIDSLHVMPQDSDLVRARSRLARDFLAQPELTHALWWDDDVVAPIERVAACIRGMLATCVDMIASLYPRKYYHWAAAANAADPEQAATEYPLAVHRPGDACEAYAKVTAVRGAIEVTSVPLGFTLCTRSMLETMTEHYATTLGFDDIVGTTRTPTVALFQLAIVGKVLLSEDYSFCHRWRAIGGKVHVYVGDGAPLDHVGQHCFRGKPEGLFREVGA